MLESVIKWAEVISCFISLIAIFISIGTVWSQNRVALFEKRYEVYSELRRILAVAEATKAFGPNDQLSAKRAFSILLERMNWTPGTEYGIRSQRVTSEVILRQMDFLYRGVPTEPVKDLLEKFRTYVDNTYAKQENSEVMWSPPNRIRRRRKGDQELLEFSDIALEPWISDFFEACSSDVMAEIECEMKRTLRRISLPALARKVKNKIKALQTESSNGC